jgi:hypothetical protein
VIQAELPCEFLIRSACLEEELLSGRPASRTLGRDTTRIQPHLDRTRDTAKADQLDFGKIRDQRSLTHRREREIARATSVLRRNAIAGKNHQMCARTSPNGRLHVNCT